MSLAEADAKFDAFLQQRGGVRDSFTQHDGSDGIAEECASDSLSASSSSVCSVRYDDANDEACKPKLSELFQLPGVIQHLVEDNRVLEENVQHYETALAQACAEISKVKRENDELKVQSNQLTPQLALLRKLANSTKVENQKLRAENERLREKYDEILRVMVEALQDEDQEDDLDAVNQLLHYENCKLRELLGIPTQELPGYATCESGELLARRSSSSDPSSGSETVLLD